MKKILLSISLFCISINLGFSQSILFPDDEKERGYHNRSYKRYEAEPNKCQTDGVFLSASVDQRTLQSEASNQIALELHDKGSFVEWTVENEVDGLNLRFSLPDNKDGLGTKGLLAVYIDDGYTQNIILDSYWAWQYFTKVGAGHSDNLPSDDKFARMRFDEIHVKLKRKVQAGEKIKLVKLDDNTTPYTIDFIELEKIPDPISFEDIEDKNKIIYDSSEDLSVFIREHGGKTIYIPAGKHNVHDRIYIRQDGTKLIGAGMWHTELYFAASSDDIETYARRGIETESSNIVVDGLYLNTINNKRYFANNEVYQVGKGFMGGFGTNSVIRNVWVEHFECGAWFGDYKRVGANNLFVEHCRFRNNYADGLNLSSGLENAVVQFCSFRNNGDDDMASWSVNDICVGNTFRYNTAENNWRASSLGFFGGKQNKAHHCVIIDPMEAGVRVTCDFPGTGFSSEGYSKFSDISIYRAGVGKGTPGIGGDLWGNRQGALHIHSTQQYDLINFEFSDIDIYDSKSDAIFMASYAKQFDKLILRNININTTEGYGIYYYQPQGNGRYCNITFNNIGADKNINLTPSSFNFIEDCEGLSIRPAIIDRPQISVYNKTIHISNTGQTSIWVYDIAGTKRYATKKNSDKIEFDDLDAGIYFIKIENLPEIFKVLVN